jgi:glycosyltransferase involved in cell wall biosynthesis
MAFFSVITPLYNKQDFIATTLQSALAQTFTDFEILVINDGSTDGSEAVVNAITDPRIVYHKTANRGVSAARNTGIERAGGEIIAFLDADDTWQPNHLQLIYNLYKDNPTAGMLLSRYTIRIGNGKLVKPYFINVPDSFSGIVKDSFGASLVNRLAVTSGVTVVKRVFDEVGLFNTQLSNLEDTEMWIRIGLKYPVAITDTYTMIYNFEAEGSLSKKKMAERNIMDFNQFLKEEAANKSLKAFIDLYRIEYALKFRIEGDSANSQKLYKQASPANIHYKIKLLFATPPFILRNLLRFKHWLHKKGISVSVYN